MSGSLLTVEGLTLEFPGAQHSWVPVVEDVSFDVRRGEILALVGESGSGKTVTSLAVLGLLPFRGGRVASGSVRFEGKELVGLGQRAWRPIRGGNIGMIFQQPVLTLNPAYTVGDQIAETIRAHRSVSRKVAWARAVELLDRVGIANAAKRARDYPHMFSGGMCQRAMIAQALSCQPALLIADEPTTALDVSVQAKILELILDIQRETGISVLLITHDLGVVAETADRIVVMYAGQVFEQASTEELLFAPRNPYTQALIGAIPTTERARFVSVPGSVPTPGHIPPGCRFAPRCRFAAEKCAPADPPLLDLGGGRLNRCARNDELAHLAAGHQEGVHAHAARLRTAGESST